MKRFDCIFLACMWLVTYVAFQLARLPYAFNMATLTKTYLLMPVGATFSAIVITVLGLPFRVTVHPFLMRLRSRKALVFILAYVAVLAWRLLGIGQGTVVFVDILGVAEVSWRYRDRLGSKLLDILIPALYLFAGLVAVFALNHAIVGIRFGGTDDALLSRFDSMFFHANVSSIAHWGFHHFPARVLEWFDYVYFSIWSRFGAVLVLLALLASRKDAVQFVRNILVCYAVALLVFAAIPGKGPYSTGAIHVSDYPKYLDSYGIQEMLVSRMKALYAHTLTPAVREVSITDYFISFPSMHAALPLIALWFLRRWRRMLVIAALFYLQLIPALVFLDWHYLVDILGGWGVAALSIAITEWISSRSLEADPGYIEVPNMAAPGAASPHPVAD